MVAIFLLFLNRKLWKKGIESYVAYHNSDSEEIVLENLVNKEMPCRYSLGIVL